MAELIFWEREKKNSEKENISAVFFLLLWRKPSSYRYFVVDFFRTEEEVLHQSIKSVGCSCLLVDEEGKTGLSNSKTKFLWYIFEDKMNEKISSIRETEILSLFKKKLFWVSRELKHSWEEWKLCLELQLLLSIDQRPARKSLVFEIVSFSGELSFPGSK